MTAIPCSLPPPSPFCVMTVAIICIASVKVIREIHDNKSK